MGMVSFGKRLFGKVDKVPQLYHVATQCWHFCYLPLVPLGTYLVLYEHTSGNLHRTVNEFEGIRIPFSFKSLLVAWSRTLLTLPFVLLTLSAVVVPFAAEHYEKKGIIFVGALDAGVVLLLFGPYFIPGIGRATKKRAEQLAAIAASGESVGRTSAKYQPVGDAGKIS